MYPNSLIFFPSRAATSDNFSAPPRTPTQHVPHEAERHSTGIGPSTRRGSISRQLRERSSAAPHAKSCTWFIRYVARSSFSSYVTVHFLFTVRRKPSSP